MKFVVISDSHGNIANLKHVLGFAKKIKAKAIIHCGDWDNLLAAETLTGSGVDIYTILGNADIDPELVKKLKLKSKKFDEKFLKIEIGGRKIGIVHNMRDLTSNPQSLDILFCGHLHNQQKTIINGVKVVNPGALEHNISFAVYDTDPNNIKFFGIEK